MPPLNILLVKSGEAASAVRRLHGDYEQWFRHALSGEKVRWQVVRPFTGEPLPEPAGADAIIISGSPLSVVTPEPWMHEARAWARRQVEAGTPVLGVCFGHQLLGWAFGARVVRNPRGREIGTNEVLLNEHGASDPLFEGIDRRFPAQTTHEDALEGTPEGALLLAGNENTPVQAFAIGRARAVQFHPELSAETMRAVVHARREAILREAATRGEDPEATFARTLEGVRDAPGERMLRNFARMARG
ncbi:MAG: glutamine amidotransferase [Myxococcales bacterium]